ncbi:hypothetical protein TRFO_24551 [Tritrichomonas foetus]|uniref:Uncharacterized protein n=1 Tax=Tritrichomonas foetus TaxID=1144522 RepID=A0A1J4K757_9EUKA|nr:hypothetical protein TRFO_24551 [Tritrichomonas foetus]|eukprot:OHT07297.1 hypothetical protein TRFO_24551 [Tritrichomonas foetus]
MSIKQNIPKNLRSTISQLLDDAEYVKNNPPSLLQTSGTSDNGDNSDNNNTNNDDDDDSVEVTQKLEDLELKLLNQIKTKFDTSISDIDHRIEQLEKSMQNRLEKFSQPTDEETKIKYIDQLLLDLQKKEQSRIEKLEKNIDKIKSLHQPIENSSKISDSIHKSSTQISTLRFKLANIMTQLDLNPKFHTNALMNENITKNESTSNYEGSNKVDGKGLFNFKNEQKSNNEECFDAVDQIEKIKNDMNNFKNIFAEEISKTQNQSRLCEKKIQEIDSNINELQNSANSIEEKVAQAEFLIQDLNKEMDDIIQKSNDEAVVRTIHKLAAQIKSSTENIRGSIASIKNRVKKCEMSVPLVVMD